MFVASWYIYFLLLFFVLFVYFVLPWFCSRCQRRTLAAKAKVNRVLVLSIDDGPGCRLTPKILDILAENGIKGCFFLLGKNIDGREALVRRIVVEGHEIGSHGYDHLHAWRVCPWKCIQDIKKSWQVIDGALGIQRGVYPFRPPYGKLNLVTLLYLWYKRVPIVFWTVDSNDTRDWNNDQNSLEILAKQLDHGGVLLVHDFDRSTNQCEQYVLDVIKLAIDIAQKNNLKMVTQFMLKDKSS